MEHQLHRNPLQPLQVFVVPMILICMTQKNLTNSYMVHRLFKKTIKHLYNITHHSNLIFTKLHQFINQVLHKVGPSQQHITIDIPAYIANESNITRMVLVF